MYNIHTISKISMLKLLDVDNKYIMFHIDDIFTIYECDGWTEITIVRDSISKIFRVKASISEIYNSLNKNS